MSNQRQSENLTTYSTVASVWLARLGWLPRQAKLALRGGWRRIKKAISSVAQHKAGLPVPNMQFLCGLAPNKTAQPGRTIWIILGPCHYNFNSGVRAIGRTRVAPTTNTTMTAKWLLASNLRNRPAAMKCQINNLKSGVCQRQHQPDGYLFNSGLRVIGKTRVAPRTSKTRAASPTANTTTTAKWVLLWILRKRPAAMKCQINNLKNGGCQRQHQPDGYLFNSGLQD